MFLTVTDIKNFYQTAFPAAIDIKQLYTYAVLVQEQCTLRSFLDLAKARLCTVAFVASGLDFSLNKVSVKRPSVKLYKAGRDTLGSTLRMMM